MVNVPRYVIMCECVNCLTDSWECEIWHSVDKDLNVIVELLILLVDSEVVAYQFMFFNRFISVISPGLKNLELAEKGFMGNPGFAGILLGITTPLFIKYFPYGLPFIALAIAFSHGFVGMLIFLVSILIYILRDKKQYKKLAIIGICLMIVLSLGCAISHFTGSFKKNLLFILRSSDLAIFTSLYYRNNYTL